MAQEIPREARMLAEQTFGFRPRFMPMVGPSMEPTISARDYVAVVPCDRFECDALYVIEQFGAPCVVRAQHVGGLQIRLSYDNTVFSGGTVPAEAFDEMVIGRVFGILGCIDHAVLRRLADG